MSDAEALLATIGEAAPDSLWVADAAGEIVYVNRQWCEYTGLTREQMRDKGFLQPVHPDDLAGFRAVAERAVREGKEFEHEFRYRRRDGVYRWCWARSVPLRDAAGNVVHRVGMSRDIDDRRRAEDALRRSRDVLDTVFEQAAVGLMLVDEQGKFVRVNRAFAEMCGYAPEEMVGLDALSLLVPEQREEAGRRRARALGGEAQPARDFTVLTRDGRPRTVRTSASTFVESEGRRLLVGVAHDVTEQREAERALLETGRRLHSVLDSIADGYVVLDAEFRFVEVNAAALRMVFDNRPVGDLIGKVLWDEYPQGEGSETFRQFRTAMREGVPVHFEAASALTSRWFETHAYPREGGASPGAPGSGRLEIYFRDITERKSAEAALAASEREFRAIFELAASGKSQTDPVTGRFLRVNRKLCEITGYSEAELLRMTFYEITHPDDVPRDRERIAAVRAGEVKEWLVEKRYVRKGGQVAWVNVAGSAIRDAAGNVLRLIATIQDVTARHVAQEEARVAREQAEAANSAKDQFLAVLSHELRTPLTPVVMTLAGLEMDRTLSQGVRDDLAMIRRNVELETKLIDDLLDVTRIAHGKLRLHPQPADAHALLESVLDLFYSDVRVKRLDLSRAWDAADARVSGDPARLQQVFWNLVKNAIKFTREGGRVRVRTFNPNSRTLSVEVSDDGVGIDPAALPRLFNAFEQAEQSVTRQFGGLGLGLAISRALVELHGGAVRAHSAGRGRGATFTVELPTIGVVEKLVGQIAPGPSGQSGDEVGLRTPAPSSQPHVRVLLVEDHPDTLRVLKRLLEKMGYAVVPASSAAAAIEALGAHAVDVIVSDIGLPDATGHDLMRKVRAHPAHGRVPAIAISGFGMDADVRNSHDAGFLTHMTKPVDVRQLDAAIRTAVKHKGESAPAGA